MLRSVVGKALSRIIETRNNARDFYYSYSPIMRHPERMTPHGFSMIAGNSLHHRSMQDGTFEPEEVALMSALLKRASVFVDIGANIGFYSCLARSLGKYVVAIEPQEQNLKYLYSNLQGNGWKDVEVYPMGLSDHPGVETLYGISSTGASLLPGWAAQPKSFTKTIPVSTLDIMLGSRFSGKEVLIKLDVEGFEYQVLRGCREILSMQPRPIWMVEICLSEFHPGGLNPRYRDTFDTFFNAGYEARAANEYQTRVTPADIERHVKTGLSDSGVLNYLMVAP